MKEYSFKINGNDYAVQIKNIDQDGVADVTVNGAEYDVEVIRQVVKSKAQSSVVTAASETPAVVAAPKAAPTSAMPVKSPLPGVINNIIVKVGDTVKVGQHLLVLEAMKMENNIDSDRAGVVKSIVVGRGDSVLEGDVLLTIE